MLGFRSLGTLPKLMAEMATCNGSSSSDDKSGKTGVTVNEYPHFEPPPLELKVAEKELPSITSFGTLPTPAQVLWEYTCDLSRLPDVNVTQ